MSRRSTLRLAGLVAGLVVVRLALGLGMDGPVIHGDEAGYILNARWLAGEGPPPRTRYFPGYSLLLVPAAWVTESPLGFYNVIIVTNALLGGVLGLAAWGLTGAFLGPERTGVRLAVAAATSLYPAFVSYSNLALSENALVPATMVTAYCLMQSVQGERVPGSLALGLGVLGAYQVVVHPRGAAVLLAAVVVAAVFWRPWRRRLAAFALLAVGAIAVLVVGGLAVRAATDGGAAVASGYDVDVVAGSRLSLAGVLDMAVGALGQVLYVVAATYGLAVVGLWAAARHVRRGVRWGDARPAGAGAVSLFAIVASLSVLAMSAWLVSPSATARAHPDSLLYGRLNEGVLAPLLLVGLCALANAATSVRLLVRSVAATALVAVVAAVSLRVFRAALAGAEIDNPIGVIGTYPLQAVLSGGRFAPLLLAAFAVVSVSALMALARWRPAVAVSCAAVAFFAVGSAMALRYLLPGSAQRATERGAIPLIAMLEERGARPACVAFDDAGYSFWHHDNYRVFLEGIRVERFASRRREAPCGPVVLTTRDDLASNYAGARLWRRLDEGLAVWVLPGDSQDAVSDVLAA